MRAKNSITRFLISLFALAILWGVLFLSKFVLEYSSNENFRHIPNDARFIVSINGRRLLEEGFNTVILAEDEGMIKLIEALYKRKSQGKKDRSRLGIDYNSDIIFFSKDYNGVVVDGLILNLDQSKLFRKYITEFLGKNQATSANDQIGVILTQQLDEDQEGLSQTELQIQADKILEVNTEEGLANELITAHNNGNTIAKTISRNGFIRDSDLVRNSNLTFELKDNKVLVNGGIDLKLHMHKQLSKRIKPDGIHFTAKALSDAFRDSVETFFSELSLPTNQLCGISMNYHGLEIVEEPTLFVVPHIDALMKFDEPFDLQLALDSLESTGQIKQGSHQFTYGSSVFYWRQFDEYLIYIGLNKDPEIVDFSGKEIFLLDGRLDRLTNVESTQRMEGLLNLFPKYSASKALSLKINTCHISVIEEKGHYKLSGEIDFIKDQHAINAFLSFLIESQVL